MCVFKERVKSRSHLSWGSQYHKRFYLIGQAYHPIQENNVCVALQTHDIGYYVEDMLWEIGWK